MKGPYTHERNVIARLVIDLFRNVSGHEEHWGTKCDQTLILCAITIGETEGRPMSATKIAGYVGIPRGTLARKLQQLRDMGWVEVTERRRYLTTAAMKSDEQYGVIVARAVASIQQAARELENRP